MKYENNSSFNESNSSDSATPTDASTINYDDLQEAFYNALVEYNENSSDSRLGEVSSSGLDAVQFSSNTDATYYTVGFANTPSSVAVQELGYLLDIRNILLIFLFLYFIISIYGKLKATIINFYERS